VQAHGLLVEFREIQDLVHWFNGIHSGWHGSMNVESVSTFKQAVTCPLFVLHHPEVLDSKPTDWHCHPAILVLMVVNAGKLANLPTNGQQFELLVPKNQVPRIVVLAEEKILL